MARTNMSVISLYEGGQWVPQYTTAKSSSLRTARVLTTSIFSIGTTNRITVTYICKSNNIIISAGYVYFDYTQDSVTSLPPTTTLIHKYTDGNPSAVSWLVSVPTLTTIHNSSELYLQVSASNLTVEFSVEADDIAQISNIYNDIVFTLPPTFDEVTSQELISNEIWQYNDNRDIFNINATGRVGINTGSKMATHAVLDVNGNVHFRGLMSLQYPGSDLVFTDSASGLGYDFRVFNESKSVYRLYIDDVGQVGINTNAPRNMFHVVGNAQITECVSIGAGNTPLAKLDVKGQGNTHATTALLIKNSDDREMFRIYDDCVIEFCGGTFNPGAVITCEDLIHTNLPIPDITNTWTVTSDYNHPSDGNSTNEDHIVAKGAVVTFDGTYKYVVVASNNESDPDRIDGDWGTSIPGSNVDSAALLVTDIVSDTTFTVTLYKQKEGLIIVDGQVVCPLPGEEDSAEDTATIKFWDSYYFGYTLASNPTKAEVEALMKDDKYINGRQQTQYGVDPVGEQYTVYAYPTAYGELADVILNGASAVLGAFNLQGPLTLENHAGKQVECHVYVSNAMDAFTDDELKFL